MNVQTQTLDPRVRTPGSMLWGSGCEASSPPASRRRLQETDLLVTGPTRSCDTSFARQTRPRWPRPRACPTPSQPAGQWRRRRRARRRFSHAKTRNGECISLQSRGGWSSGIIIDSAIDASSSMRSMLRRCIAAAPFAPERSGSSIRYFGPLSMTRTHMAFSFFF